MDKATETSIQFRTIDPTIMEALYEDLIHDLAEVDLAEVFQVGEPQLIQDTQVTRGDPNFWATVALTAVGAGGALTVLLSKDGVLAALAAVLEKYIENRQVEVLIERSDGEKIQVRGPASDIRGILSEIKTNT